nr:DNA double-strand break repair nuclease NurA [Candidatus Sigynarchaeota archaeon]
PARDQYADECCRRLTELLIDIINTCEENGTMLVGVVKDSTRAEHAAILRHLIPVAAKDDKAFEPFLQFDYPQALELMKDYDFFFRFLEQGERSFVLKSHPKGSEFIPSNLFERYLKVKNIGLYSYLIKPVPLDMPLRVEIFAPNDPKVVKKHVTRSSSMLYPLSSIVFDYSEPSPQLEAHKRVKIQEQDFKILIDVLRRKTNYCSTMLQKRRERRPL